MLCCRKMAYNESRIRNDGYTLMDTDDWTFQKQMMMTEKSSLAHF